MFVNVKDLPISIRNALKDCSYHKADIEINFVESLEFCSRSYGNGYRGFTAIVDIATGYMQKEYGSWGGDNPFESKAVDRDNTIYNIPEGSAIIKGNAGEKVFAKLYLSPKNVVPGLLPESNLINDDEYKVLNVFVRYKPAYRKEHLVDKENLIQKCIDCGYLKKDGRGITITTDGKNVVNNYRNSNNLPNW